MNLTQLLALAFGLSVLALGRLWLRKNRARFAHRIDRDAMALWLQGAHGGVPLTDKEWVSNLPASVQRYAIRVLSDEHPPIGAARLRQRGNFRTTLDGPWRPLEAVEYIATASPGFVWWGRVRLAPGLWFDAHDRSVGGDGSMHVELAASFTLANAQGPAIDAGALVRLLGELVWAPSALFDRRYISWAEVDERQARATIRVEGREESANFHFGDNGLPTEVTAMRQFDLGGGKSVLRPWSVDLDDYRAVQGRLIPFAAVVHWHVDGKRVPVARMFVDSVEYGILATYS
jgi:hypothetical protein